RDAPRTVPHRAARRTPRLGKGAGDAPDVPARSVQPDDRGRGRAGRLLRALLAGRGVRFGLIRRVVTVGRGGSFIVREHHLASIAETDEPAERPRLLDELLGRRKVAEDLLIEADEDPTDRLP